ncbi:MAG TPA: hypothetical protein VFI59_15680 [Actinomycetota bacterium]|nr:hypothetical protein [Actinomycetota bacterium]
MKVELVTVKMPPLLLMPPPAATYPEAVLFENVERATFNAPSPAMAPPCSDVLSENTELVMVALPPLEIPPPSFEAVLPLPRRWSLFERWRSFGR